MAVAAASMAVAAALTNGLSISHVVRRGRRRSGIPAGIAAFHRVVTDREASPFVIASALRTLVRGLWSALLVLVALELLGLGRSGVGVLNAVAGVGAVIALPITASLIGRPRLAGACAAAFIAGGLALSVVGTVHVVAVALLVVCAWGVAMALADATSLSLLSRLLDAKTLSRTVGVMESLKLALEGLGALLAPALVALFGLRPALVLAGLPLPVVIFVSYPRMRRADAAAAGRGALVSLLHRTSVLSSLDMASLEDVAARGRRTHAGAGTEIVRQGDPGDAFYVIESGSAEVLLDRFGIGQLGPGSGFGERALLRAVPRTATVRALNEMTLYEIDRTSFLSAVTGQPPEALEDAAGPVQRTGPDPRTRPLPEVLGAVTFLRALGSNELERLADAATIEDWQPGDAIIREGEAATAFFVLLSGRARATINGRQVNELWPGDCFGEIAILHQVPRTATVAAAEATRTCRVPAEALLEMIGS
jgi:CRP-like cAMP-binding protein